MIFIYNQSQAGIEIKKLEQIDTNALNSALWIDMLCPTSEEEHLVEDSLKISIPTKKEMEEIEPSSRLYTENNTLFMTAIMIAKSDTPEPKSDPITFIITKNKLITIRYIEPQSFNLFISRLRRSSTKEYTAEKLLIELLETTTDRLADILENISGKFDDISKLIFNSSQSPGVNYKQILQSVGITGDLATKVRESLVSFIRLVPFFEQGSESKLSHDMKTNLMVVNKDINALSDYAGFISSKVNFLLDATLGMVNIEQNNIIKILSVAAVIFLPPTLIASIYGMNFSYMPELHWYIGYPIALTLMILSAWIPYRYFKKHKWL